MKCIIARISNPYGIIPQKNRTQGIIPILLSQLLLHNPITLYGETIRDYIYISDVVEALHLLGLYEKGKRIFNIGTGISTTLHDLVHMLETVAETNFFKIFRQNIRNCDVYENVLDISDTVNELKWHPKILLEEGIRITLNQMLENRNTIIS
jgi:UDP-glucose 4-epimerase